MSMTIHKSKEKEKCKVTLIMEIIMPQREILLYWKQFPYRVSQKHYNSTFIMQIWAQILL